ncbi:MAG: flippase-like domain-containing protein [Anaerolineae bacterium]|nr:flippase-like domain-containing protein [Anaerolineae bacterium]
MLTAILVGVDLAHVFEVLRDMDWLPFLGALTIFLSGAFIRAYRWGSLVWALGVKVRWLRLVELHFVGAFFGMFLPTGVGGDAVKMYELSRHDHKASAAISSVLVDRFTGLFVLFAIALLALIGGHELVTQQVRLLIALVFAVSLVAVALVLQRTWIESWGRRLGLDRLLGRVRILRELYLSLHLYGSSALLRATGASLAWNLVLISSYYLLGQAVGLDLSLWYYLLFVPVISVLLLIPSVAGLGIREGATILLFQQVGVSEPRALALALAYDAIRLTEGLIGAGLYVLQGLVEARRQAR